MVYYKIACDPDDYELDVLAKDFEQVNKINRVKVVQHVVTRRDDKVLICESKVLEE